MDVETNSKDVVRARIDKDLKKEASTILANMGLTVSDYVRISLTKVVNERGLPFDMYVPNTETLKTFEKTDKGEDVFYAKDATDLFKQLDI